MKSFLACFVFVFLTLTASAEEKITVPTQFSAEMNSNMKSGDKEMVTKSTIYVDGDRKRFETSAMGQNMITILRSDKKVIYTLMVAQKMYMEMPFKEQPDVLKNLKDPSVVMEDQGTETIRTQECRKYKVTVKDQSSLIWVNAKTKLPVRCVAADGKATIDWDNYKIGAQPTELFEVPADYKKFDMPNMSQ